MVGATKVVKWIIETERYGAYKCPLRLVGSGEAGEKSWDCPKLQLPMF